MKNTKAKNDDVYLERVVPFFGVQPEAEELFDDCPLCQELRKMRDAGEATHLDEMEGWVTKSGERRSAPR